jgi:hypothetical protein
MDPALIDMLPSGAIRYLRPDILNRPAVHVTMPTWPTQMVRENVIQLPEYISLTVPARLRYLTPQEQAIISSALRRSVKVVRAGASRA